MRLALGFMWLCHFLPLPVLARLGQALGMALYAFGRERRTVCLANLARCFPHMDERQRRRLARAHFRAQGRAILERGILWWASRRRIFRLVRFVGKEHLDRWRDTPLIIFAPHFVGLDAAPTRLSAEGEFAGIFSRQKSALMDRMLQKGRHRFGAQRTISRQEGIRPLLAALRSNVPVFYLPDQDYGARDSIFVPFFGVPAATITALSRLARVARARVMPCVIRMLPGGRGYEVRFYPVWDNYPSDDVEADTRRMNAFIEERTLEMPEQYNWAHKRFKTRPAGEAKWY
jgi:Kdo2-lipid IVA lauroyltransferase/acyltransferase